MAQKKKDSAVDERHELLNDFCRETEAGLDQVEKAIAGLRRYIFDLRFEVALYVNFIRGLGTAEYLESLRQINRFVHTAKGITSFLDLPQVNSYCHTFEELSLDLVKGRSVMNRPAFKIIEALPNVINRFLQTIREENSDAGADVSAEIEEIENCRRELLELMEGRVLNLEEIQGRDLGQVRPGQKDLKITVDLSFYDAVLRDYQAFLQGAALLLRGQDIDEAVMRSWERGMNEHLEKLLHACRGEIVLSRYPRLTSDLSKHLEKRVLFTIRRNEAKARPDVWDHCHNALVHMIRNAIDHGIELPAEREQAGKNPEGSIELEVYEDFRNIYIILRDDGRGIDPERVAAKALAEGLVSESQLLAMSDREKQGLIFQAGFSTRQQASNVSGRGVGMDAVVKEVEGQLAGRVNLNSQPGLGTMIELEIPKVETLSECITFGDDEYRYAVPLTADVRFLECEGSRIHNLFAETMVYSAPDGEFTLLNLFALLHPAKYSGSSVEDLPIIRFAADNGGQPFGIIVPNVFGQERLKIDRRKAVSRLTANQGMVFGFGLTDPVTIVLDIDYLMKQTV